MKPIKKTVSMNKLELEYSQHLERMKKAGHIIDWRFNSLRFKLGSGAWYKPDFFVIYKDRFELHETKGFMREAANVRLKVAAELYPWFNWVVIRRARGRFTFEGEVVNPK